MRHLASQRFFFTKNDIFVFLLDHIVIFPYFFEAKKTRNETWRRLVQMRARELRYLTICCNFGTMSVPKLPPLKLKSVLLYACWFSLQNIHSFMLDQATLLSSTVSSGIVFYVFGGFAKQFWCEVFTQTMA